MDLSKLSTPDLEALQGGDLTKVSTGALQYLQTGQFSSGSSYDAVGGNLVPTGSEAAQAAQSPTSRSSFWQNALEGAGKLYTDAGLGARQIYSSLTGGPSLNQEVADKRALDAPLQGTWGGKVGQVAGALPAAFIPGANTYAGAALIGGGMGALQPTVEGESRALNTGIGAGIGVASKYAGDTFSNWLQQRAAQPFLGWNQKAGNAAAAQAVGSDASALNQSAIHDTSERLGGIFQAARSPDVTIPVKDATVTALEGAGNDLNTSSRSAFFANDQVKDLISHLGSNPSAAQLGDISSKLNNEAYSQMSSKSGDRALGQALYAVKEHVDDLIGGSISDPALKAAYDAARPQYRTFVTLTRRPTLLNSSTGDVNLRNLGNYLQKYDAGFREGTNTSPLYEAARFGQASTIGSRPPPPILQPFKFAAYHALNNPIVGAATGTVSRIGAPVAPAIKAGLPALAVASEPVLLPYLEQ